MRDDFDADPPTALERLPLPFILHDELVEPFPSFMVIHVIFERPVGSDTVGRLAQVMDDWLVSNAAVAQSMGEPGPDGETLQTGDQTVEIRIHGAQGNPDACLGPMLKDLARLSRFGPRIVQVEMD